MRKLAVVLLVFITSNLCAQDGIQPMVKQIALLQVYIGYLQKGYAIAKDGLNLIGNIKNGHWHLDIAFFNSLKTVSPVIKKYSKVAAIMNQQLQIVKECGRLRKLDFQPDEAGYINQVADQLLRECEVLGDLLLVVTTNNKLQLSDDERIKRIDTIYETTMEQYHFIRSFSEDAKLLVRQRQKEMNDIDVTRKSLGL